MCGLESVASTTVKRKSIHACCLQLSGKLHILIIQPGLVLCEGCVTVRSIFVCLFVCVCVCSPYAAELSGAIWVNTTQTVVAWLVVWKRKKREQNDL